MTRVENMEVTSELYTSDKYFFHISDASLTINAVVKRNRKILFYRQDLLGSKT